VEEFRHHVFPGSNLAMDCGFLNNLAHISILMRRRGAQRKHSYTFKVVDEHGGQQSKLYKRTFVWETSRIFI